MAIERSNLINISKLVVKELMESSVPFGRMLDSDHVPLQHFFIVLEHALRHGLRPKRVGRLRDGRAAGRGVSLRADMEWCCSALQVSHG